MGQGSGRHYPKINDDSAVVGINLVKTLDKGPMAFKIFDHVNIEVKKYTIYGLLGASGCGKTTLLKCLLGLLPVDHGDIWVLGGKPNTPDSGVPGYQVGYMPQDISLLPEHTVRGAVRYFAGLAGKTKAQIEAKYTFFAELVELPKPGLRVKTLSGGDQRKVSLVCALIHEPDLLILDEPTAGLEPKVRGKIYAYLKQITSVEKRSTVMITTHYIEEVGAADRLGILRNAHIIAEDSPGRLMRRYRGSTLEETVILLSHEQDGTQQQLAAYQREVPLYLRPLDEQEEEEPEAAPSFLGKSTVFVGGTTRPKNYLKLRFYNTCHKNMVRLIQNPTASLFSLVFPILIIASLFIAIGDLPKSRFAVFNEDIENYASNRGQNSLRSNNIPRDKTDPREKPTQRGNTDEIFVFTLDDGVSSTRLSVTTQGLVIMVNTMADSPESNQEGATEASAHLPKQTEGSLKVLPTTDDKFNNTENQNTSCNGDAFGNLMKSKETEQTFGASNNGSAIVTDSPSLITTISDTDNSHQIKRSVTHSDGHKVTSRLNKQKNIGYHEDRISDLVEYRGGLALPNLTCNDIVQRIEDDKNRVLLSCVFLKTLQEIGEDVFQLDYFQDLEKVRQAVERGEYRGFLLIYKNYTPSLEWRFRGGVSSMLAPLSPVYVGLDMTDKHSGVRVQQELSKVQQRAVEKYHRLLSPDVDVRYFSVPVSLGRSSNNNAQQIEVDFVTPGVMIAMTFFLQSGLTSGSIILERNTGLWERNSVLGVTSVEIVASHLLMNSVLAFVQSALVVIVVYYIYEVACHGSLLVIFVIVFLQAITGEFFGFLCSVFSRSITEVNFINLGLYYPVIHLCGVVWPVEAISPYIRPLAYVLPLTPAIEAVRQIQAKGGLLFYVWLTSFVWISLFSLAIFATIQCRRVH